jgi:PadR family transcriptional regulator PadR
MSEYKPRNFLPSCLLLLLSERPDHGYDLVNRLSELHSVHGDGGTVYRALRALEQQGLVHSAWHASDAGPARRIYRLTQQGETTLETYARILEETHCTLHLFRERYVRLSSARTGPATAPALDRMPMT